MSTTYGATTTDVIKGALRRITSYQSGESLAAPDIADCLDTFNDLLASWSTDDNFIPGVVEYVTNWTAGKNTYNVGNPLCTELGFSPYQANAQQGSNLLVAAGGQPSNVAVGATLTDSQNVIPTGVTNSTAFVFAGLPPASTNNAPGATVSSITTVTAINLAIVFTVLVPNGAVSAVIASVNGLVGAWTGPTTTSQVTFSDNEFRSVTFTNGSTAVTWSVGLSNTVSATAILPNVAAMSNNAVSTTGSNTQVTYSVPGDFLPAFRRPLLIKFGFTRFNNLDFPLDVEESMSEYGSILYKPQPGPWPTVAWYNNTYPYGTLKCYQTPGNNAELHLFVKVILNDLNANQPILLPPGYVRALKWCLARELWVEYVNPMQVPIMLEKLAMESLKMIKDLNAKPAQRAKYDRALVRGNRADGGWIFYGGYR